jgi:hypothetical protein
MKQATGVITLAQEGRFRLATADGRSQLFILSHDAPMEPQDLPRLAAMGLRVVVHYSEAADRIAGLAHDITRPRDRPRRHVGYISLPRNAA